MNASLPLGSVLVPPTLPFAEVLIVAYGAHVSGLRLPPMAGGPEEQQVAEFAVCSNSVCSQRQGWHGAISASCFLHTRFPFLPICLWCYAHLILICVSEMGSSCPPPQWGFSRGQVAARSTLVKDHEIAQENILQINNTCPKKKIIPCVNNYCCFFVAISSSLLHWWVQCERWNGSCSHGNFSCLWRPVLFSCRDTASVHTQPLSSLHGCSLQPSAPTSTSSAT